MSKSICYAFPRIVVEDVTSFFRQLRFEEFDVSEMSLSSYVVRNTLISVLRPGLLLILCVSSHS